MKADNDWDEEKILKVRKILFDKWQKINFQLRGTISPSPVVGSIQSVQPSVAANASIYKNSNSIFGPIHSVQSVQPIKPSTSTLNEIEWKDWLLENNIKSYKELWTCVQFLDNDHLMVDISPVATDVISSRKYKLFLLVPKDFAKKLIVLSTFED
jgi:hypothetical protein